MNYNDADVNALGSKLNALHLTAGEAMALDALITFASPHQGATAGDHQMRAPLTQALHVALLEPEPS